MSLYTKKLKDNNYRFFFNFYEKKKLILKSLIFNNLISLNKSILLQLVLGSLPRKSSISYINNRCYLTYRSRGVLSKFKLSRHIFKKFATKGYLCNFKKL